MDVIADAVVAFDGFDDVMAEIAGMRCRKADAAQSRHFGSGVQQFREFHFARRWIGIGVYGLAEELNFGVTELGELAEFAEDGIAGAATFGPACKRHNAIRASFVAAFD